MTRFVVLDLETTGMSFSEGDRILEIAYCVMENDTVIRRFQSHVQTEKEIPPFVQQLTQIEQKDVAGAPAFEELAPEILSDLDGAWFVAHNVDFDLSFLNEALEDAGYSPFSGPVLDTVELSRIFFPTAESFRLQNLADMFSIVHDNPHQALSDAEASASILLKIMEKGRSLPPASLHRLLYLQQAWKSDMGALLGEWLEHAEVPDGVEEYRGTAVRVNEEIKEAAEACGTDPSAYLTSEVLASVHPSMVERTAQQNMSLFVQNILNDGHIGIAEAGTGTGKTLAYLLPAVLTSLSEEKRVLVSTETIQLQEQILYKEIPVVETLLNRQVRASLMKGRSHYLCLQKLEHMLSSQAEKTYDQQLSLSQIIVWLTQTASGDLEEVNAASGERFMYELVSEPGSCSSPDCPWFSRCFYQRARKKARHSDIIITNHAMLLTDISTSVLPSYQHIIVDEAHHLQKTASRQFAERMSYADAARPINEWLQKPDPILPDFWKDRLTGLKDDWNDLFMTLYDFSRKSSAQNDMGEWSTVIDHEKKAFAKVEDAAVRLREAYRQLTYMMESEEITSQETGVSSLMEEIGRCIDKAGSLLLRPADSHVYWMERANRGPKQALTVYSSPVDVADLLADYFFAKKKHVVLTSATLAVNQSFSFVMEQLGMEDFEVKQMQAESPFDWENQAAILLPQDIPPVKEEEAYVEKLAEAVVRISSASKGKMLVLFTSYAMLKKTYRRLQEMLDDTYLVIGQGVQSKSRTKLIKLFQQFDQSILLGTSSFWEGVDIPGEDLSVLLMARLPFAPPSDPVYRAKAGRLEEEGKSPFMKLALPEAILRFRQGFGRLIRTEKDKGVVIVMDRRIEKARYGKQFLRSLPGASVERGTLEEMADFTEKWLYRSREETKHEDAHR
ncbi:ATP-dependent DNA helicase DinG [Alkalicoccus urumqiensis]|uniref:3'-5' exonuclease DinG n=1 Tax=Alkalicoccus urumqiensis TaxID=1548213 RepID=A0A2P6MKR8_ALKUR|nr:ATP-dependent DNA helicase DinG [Alkalicoccus urumqiensis]PRO66843.1 ATP-dependent helicase DinG [Alkalicoccus urumqiensis]